MAEGKPHHHGNLRAALVEAGVALVHRDGPDALSIRKVAAAAGVSHAAPAHHFPSLLHLRTAIVAEGYRRFTASMETAIAEAPNTPRDAALGACLGYLRFARANSGLFDMMFGTTDCIHDDPDLRETADASYAVLARISAPFAGADPVDTELAIWSMIHGFASLAISGNGMHDAPDLEELFLRIFEALDLSAR
ncbi:TetR-like C-terminal domain-containing protein [Maritimibacter sp. UBA3975]|uniref:TetR/AcrR family transcriptional regulator n=1 Tax=Maritimibacter sp. UBA3975 TaxID=1946833 RepID=UPI000C0ADE04|nr:TetR-like C-terminal domain-containing protein [Maritimibacter sp. UBA3975]MAM60891.1 TetR family transcriptional regulator [Maritimibacter sp.]|tara:strand:- start:7044 stop:7622 length:579 start_codon:yes stop_codon:yes gene_type:complete